MVNGWERLNTDATMVKSVQRALVLKSEGIIQTIEDPPALVFWTDDWTVWLELPENIGTWQVDAATWKAARKTGEPCRAMPGGHPVGKPPTPNQMHDLPDLPKALALHELHDPQPNGRDRYDHLHVYDDRVECGTTYQLARMDVELGLGRCSLSPGAMWKVPRRTTQALMHQDVLFLRCSNEVRAIQVDRRPFDPRSKTADQYDAWVGPDVEAAEIDEKPLKVQGQFHIDIPGLPPLRQKAVLAALKLCGLPAMAYFDPAGKRPTRFHNAPVTIDLWPLQRMS